MITVYAIRSEVNGDIYVGIAKDADLALKSITPEKIVTPKD
jgi:predicted GIY-YIG superfamily endonuclease